MPRLRNGLQISIDLPRLLVEKTKGAHGRAPFIHSDSLTLAYGLGSSQDPPKMSELPKVDGQSCCGAGLGIAGPTRSEKRQSSIAGQSEAFRTSFQTAAA